MEELRSQTQDILDGKPAQPKIFPTQVGHKACALMALELHLYPREQHPSKKGRPPKCITHMVV